MILEVISSFTKIFAFINENFGKLLVYLVKYTTCDNLLYHCNSSVCAALEVEQIVEVIYVKPSMYSILSPTT